MARIQEKLPNLLCLVSPDLSEIKHLVNGELTEQRGFTNEEVDAQKVEDIFTPQSIDSLRELMKTEVEIDGMHDIDKNRTRVIELEMKCKDGSSMFTENQLSFLHDELGKLDSVLLIARNISARKIAMIRQELAIQILECLNIEEDVDRTIGKIIGLIRENLKIDLVDFHIFESPEEAKSFKHDGNESIIPIKDNETLLGFLQLKSKDGKIFDRETIAFFERIVGSIGVAINKNRTRQALALKEEQLRHAQRIDSIGQLAGGVAHDFNNLLAAIMGHTELLMENFEDTPEEEIRESLEVIDNASKSAAELTKQLLAFGRKQTLQVSLLKTDKLFKDFQKILSRLLGDEIDLKFEYPDDLYTIEADKTQIEQIIMNLVINSRDAMPDGGKITIKAHNEVVEQDEFVSHEELKAGTYVCITVEDNGTGIPDHLIKNIFEPFFTTKPEYKGSGLGLSVVHGIVRQHDGHIAVESEVGKGTTFKILLPAITS